MSVASWCNEVAVSNCCPWPRDCGCLRSAPVRAAAPVADRGVDLGRSGDNWELLLRQLQQTR